MKGPKLDPLCSNPHPKLCSTKPPAYIPVCEITTALKQVGIRRPCATGCLADALNLLASRNDSLHLILMHSTSFSVVHIFTSIFMFWFWLRGMWFSGLWRCFRTVTWAKSRVRILSPEKTNCLRHFLICFDGRLVQPTILVTLTAPFTFNLLSEKEATTDSSWLVRAFGVAALSNP